MQIKKKICSGCDSEQYIWKRHQGEPYCKHCWSRHKGDAKSQKPNNIIPLVSSKRKKQDQEYSKLRKVFLNEHRLCKIQIAGCMLYATDVHHTFAGADRNVYYLIQSTWLPTCRVCHNWMHEHPKESRELGYLK